MTDQDDDSAVTLDDREIVDSNTHDAASDNNDALRDDDRSWIATVLTSLEGRSIEAQQALMQALLDGHNQQEQAAPLGCAITFKNGSFPPNLEYPCLSLADLVLKKALIEVSYGEKKCKVSGVRHYFKELRSAHLLRLE